MIRGAEDRQSKRLFKWNIGQKLTIASALMILLIVLIGGISIWQMHTIARTVDDLFTLEQQRAQSLELLTAGQELIASSHHMILTEDSALASTKVPVSMGLIQFYMGSLKAQAEENQASYFPEEIDTLYSDLRQGVEEVNLLVRQERWDEAHTTLMQTVVPINEDLRGLLRQLVFRNDQRVKKTIASTQATMRRVRLLMLAGIVLSSAVAIGWRQAVFQGMSNSIAKLRQGVARITGGDLEHRLDIHTGDEIEELANEFNTMAGRLSDLIGSLEKRVAERTRELEENLFELEGAAQVAREAASIRDLDQLLDETSHLISVLFGFYHTGIFLLDEAKEYAVLQAASSEGGRRMLARGHKLKVGQKGIVGYVAGSNTPRIALDVGEDAVYFDNPDMPQTRSEMAVPLEVRREVIGVLDIQSMEEAAFSDQDIAIIKSLADQIALAIENTRLLEESQRAVQELEALYGQRVRETWREQTGAQLPAYRYTGLRIEETSPSAEVSRKSTVRPMISTGDDKRQMVAPIRLRGQSIGSIALRQDKNEEPWTPEEVAMMEEVSAQVALALENARLLEETQRRAARERLTGEIIARMRETLDVDTILKTAIHEIGETLDISRIKLRMREGDGR
jgi:GAF domain-containing protein/HAMP domain-containing protein